MHEVTLDNRSDGAAVVGLAGARAPKTWPDLLAVLDGIDLSVEPPDWVVNLGSVEAEAGATGRSFIDFPAGTFGPICLTGEWPKPVIAPGAPFDVSP